MHKHPPPTDYEKLEAYLEQSVQLLEAALDLADSRATKAAWTKWEVKRARHIAQLAERLQELLLNP